ncbi:hypothetical protein [Burkholderia dolosa]|uniref:hypothetical protein n=1 Tax=Burkholderia dolosa TaxID=152500 RepID=UPI00158FF86F|nr:hypothetical protein [Burkholderia dolosa]MBY4752761.1 hypothetical protein [Burkholderia dolosa]
MAESDISGKSPAELRKDIVEYLSALRGRQQGFSFRLVTERLRANKMPTARGYDELIPKYRALSLASPYLSDYQKVIKELHRDSVLFSKRAVAFYKVDPALAKPVAAGIEALVEDKTPFSDSFPLPIAPSVLRRAGYNGRFVRFRTEGNVLRAIACAKRSFRERKPIEIEELHEEAKSALSEFDEVIGIRHGVVQAYDYIEFNKSTHILSVHIDICCPMGSEDFKQIRTHYIATLNEVCGFEAGPETSIVLPENLFPYVQKFYDDGDGKVGKLGHATGTDSVKEERMRSRRKDLRQEPFHKRGLEEIKTTDSYAIRKSWPLEKGPNTPTIELPGHFADAGNPDAAIFYAILEQCANGAQYKMLIDKLA